MADDNTPPTNGSWDFMEDAADSLTKGGYCWVMLCGDETGIRGKCHMTNESAADLLGMCRSGELEEILMDMLTGG